MNLPDSEYNRESQLEKRLKFNRKVNNDPRYGEFTVLRNQQTGQYIMMK